MTPITCRCCTRMMDVCQYRVLVNGSRVGKCRQCESADRQSLKLRDRMPLHASDPINSLLRQWRGPVNLGALRATP